MLFRDRTYSVLVVSASEKFNKGIKDLLPVGEFWPVKYVQGEGEARRLLLGSDFDVVIINSPLPDGTGIKLSTDICNVSDSSVMLFVRGEYYDDISLKVMEYGVVCVQKPVSRQLVSQNLRVMCATRERIAKVEARQATIEERMEDIRVINKAKWKLIESGMTENEAHKLIERRAMDLRMTKRAVAEEILDSTAPMR